MWKCAHCHKNNLDESGWLDACWFCGEDREKAEMPAWEQAVQSWELRHYDEGE